MKIGVPQGSILVPLIFLLYLLTGLTGRAAASSAGGGREGDPKQPLLLPVGAPWSALHERGCPWPAGTWCGQHDPGRWTWPPSPAEGPSRSSSPPPTTCCRGSSAVDLVLWGVRPASPAPGSRKLNRCQLGGQLGRLAGLRRALGSKPTRLVEGGRATPEEPIRSPVCVGGTESRCRWCTRRDQGGRFWRDPDRGRWPPAQPSCWRGEDYILRGRSPDCRLSPSSRSPIPTLVCLRWPSRRWPGRREASEARCWCRPGPPRTWRPLLAAVARGRCGWTGRFWSSIGFWWQGASQTTGEICGSCADHRDHVDPWLLPAASPCAADVLEALASELIY